MKRDVKNAVFQMNTVLCRLNCPIDVIIHLVEIRLGGWRFFDHSKFPEFQLILYSGERVIMGLNVESHLNAPFVKAWMETRPFVDAYTDVTQSEATRNKRKLNLARWALSQALVSAIRKQDRSIQITPRNHIPLADDCSQVFISGSLMKSILTI